MRAATRFLVTLSEDPLLRERFLDDPEGVMRGLSELTEEDRAAFRSGDPRTIRTHLGEEHWLGCDTDVKPPPPPPKPEGPPPGPPPGPETGPPPDPPKGP